MHKVLIPLLVLLLLMPVHALEYNVGVSPQVVELGTVDKDSSKIVRFYIVTVSSDPFIVYLEPNSGTKDFFDKAQYSQLLANFSEQETKQWAEFFSNPVELSPSTNDIGYGIKGSREINFLLNIPKDAEPGYHVINVKPSPVVQAQDLGQAGAAVVALTTVNVLFRVDGNALREGRVFDVLYTPGQLETYFKNTGTVTMAARSFTKIRDARGVYDAVSAWETVKPGEMKKMLAPVSLPAGDYTVSTIVDYTTGATTFDSSLSVKPPVTAAAIAAPQEFPWWIIPVILIILISILIYRRRK